MNGVVRMAVHVSPPGRPDAAIEVSACFDVEHDPGCWRTRNGDGWPESFDVCGFSIDDTDAAVAAWREAVPEDGGLGGAEVLAAIEDRIKAALEADGGDLCGAIRDRFMDSRCG